MKEGESGGWEGSIGNGGAIKRCAGPAKGESLRVRELDLSKMIMRFWLTFDPIGRRRHCAWSPRGGRPRGGKKGTVQRRWRGVVVKEQVLSTCTATLQTCQENFAKSRKVQLAAVALNVCSTSKPPSTGH